MKSDEVIRKIKEKAYWDIDIHPTVFEHKRIKSRQEALDIVRDSVVELRGWDYPHFTDRDGGPYAIQEGIEKNISWENHIELWRMYLSGQFIHLLGLREDRLTDEQKQTISIIQDENQTANKFIGATGTIYTLTEIFEFAKRLSQKGLFGDDVSIEIVLHDIENRALVVDSPGRIPFISPKVSREKQWNMNKTLKVSDLLENSEELAFQEILDLFELFNWLNPPTQTIKDDQLKFLKKGI